MQAEQTGAYLNSDLCSSCGVRLHCVAIVPGGVWDPYIPAQSRPCPAVLQNSGKRAELREENKPGCFGAIGKGRFADTRDCRNGTGCAWAARCRQSQEDY